MAPKKSFFSLAKRSFGVWFGGIWLVGGLPFLIIGIYIGVQTWQQSEQLKREGQMTTGMVLTKSRTTSTSRSFSTGSRTTSTTYRVGYSFKAPGGNVVKGEEEISSRIWERLEERGPIRVTFLPSRPDIHRLEGQGAGWMLPIIFTILGSLFASVGGFIFFKALAGIWRELHLGDRGKGMTVEGTVLEVAATNLTINEVPQWVIRYSYRDHKGKEHKAKSPHMSPEEAEAWKGGDKGTVRYDFRSPRKSVWLGREH